MGARHGSRHCDRRSSPAGVRPSKFTGSVERDAKIPRRQRGRSHCQPRYRANLDPIGEILPYTVFLGLMALLMIYFVGAEQGATSMISGHYVHEFVHDARHLLGFPCH